MENQKIKQFNLVLIQNKILKDRQSTIKRAEELIESAIKLHNPQIIMLPEYFTCSAGLNTLKESMEDEDTSETIKWMKEIAKKNNIYLVGGSIPIMDKDDKSKIYNTCYCIDNKGEVKTKFSKMHLFDVNLPEKKFKESDKIAPGNNFGVFETPYGKIGIGICYDIRFPEYSLLLKKEYDIDMLFYPAAFTTITGLMFWETLAKARAVDTHVFVAMCSPSRNYENPEEYQAWGHSMVLDPFGRIVTSTGYEEAIVYTKVDLERNDEMRSRIPVWDQKRWDLYSLSELK